MNKLKNPIKKEAVILSPETLIDGFLNYIQQLGGAAAVWRLPNSTTVELLADLNGGTALDQFDLLTLKTGFLMAPFQNGQNYPIHFNADIQLSIDIKEDIDTKSEFELKYTKITSDQTEELLKIIKSKSSSTLKYPKKESSRSTTKEEYIESVEAGISNIKNGTIFKVVPSKLKVVPLKETLSLGTSFLNACYKYQNAFVNLTISESTGFWLGATPETLIENSSNNYFKTVALAGTQAATESPVSATAWTQKEIEEQAYVSRYIIDCFKKIRLREYIEIGPKTIKAGSLLHLKTTYQVNTAEVNFPELASVMLNLLHPTSAVCGMPKEASLAFLQQYEKHDRSYFSGYLGPVNQGGNSHLFVNLRCCQLFNDSIHFYAGAGITEDSDPEKEWLETEMKCQVLADVLA